VFPGIRMTKSEALLLPKRHPFLGGGREVQARRPIRQVKFSLGSPPKESFQVPVFICLEIFLRGGTKSFIVYRLALGMECRGVRSGTQQCNMPSERASWYVLPGAICALSKAISGCSGCLASLDHLV